MTDARDREAVQRAADAWCVSHGLPYFTEDAHRRVGTEVRRMGPIVVVLAALSAALGFGLAQVWPDRFAWVVASQALLLASALYAVARLDAGPIFRWALRHTLGSLGLIVPLVTRALPMLLLFVTFLFINTEVWQVASHLDGGVLWGTLLLFWAVGGGFLLVKLPEELDTIDDDMDAAALAEGCRGTPLEDTVAHELAEVSAAAIQQAAQLDPVQRTNLIVVLLVSQIIQVLMLTLAMFAFFIGFGALTMDPAVLESWVGALQPVAGQVRVSVELLQVAVFLSGFSGLYFTVYAVQDGVYRKQFFTSILEELEQAISVRAATRLMADAAP